MTPGRSFSSRGVAAVSAAKTARNQIGPSAGSASALTVAYGAPCSASPAAIPAQTSRSGPTGRSSRPILARTHAGPAAARAGPSVLARAGPAVSARARSSAVRRLRAAAYPPTKKNTASVCSTHDSGASSGMNASGLETATVPRGPSTHAVTSQCPSTTPAIASARSASTPRSRPAASSPRLAPPYGARSGHAWDTSAVRPRAIRVRLRRDSPPGAR